MRHEADVRRGARRAKWGRVRLVVVVVGLGLFGLVGSGCSTHEEAVSNPCKLTKGGKVVAVEGRGAMGLAKVGLTPEGLKAQEACK